MNKILKITTLAFLLIVGVSCENDDQKIVTATGGPELLTPLDGAEYVLLPDNASSEATTLVWNHADYSQQTEVNYEVEIAKSGTEFAEIVSGGTTNNRFITWTVEALNGVALSAGLTPYSPEDVDIRIKASLGTAGELVSYSNVIKVTLTPFTNDLPKSFLIGNFLEASGYGNNWSPAETLPGIASSGFGKTDFEGYVYMNVPNPEFKVLPTNASFTGDFGDDGTFSGTLIQEGESNITLSSPGYYRVQANTGAISAANPDGLKYSVTPTTWGIIGAATPLGWDASTQLTYNPTSKKWQATVVMTAGEFKFRANNEWNINIGGFDATKPYGGEDMSYDGSNLSNATAGSYLVELDLSNPRAYKYTLTAN